MNILFVCTGNTCRSAMAEYLARDIFAQRGRKNIMVSSCGVAASSAFKVPAEVIAVMQQDRIDITPHRARSITQELVSNADHILTMEQRHADYITARFPKDASRVQVLRRLVFPEIEDPDIPDPIGMSQEFYQKTKTVIHEVLEKLAQKLEEPT